MANRPKEIAESLEQKMQPSYPDPWPGLKPIERAIRELVEEIAEKLEARGSVGKRITGADIREQFLEPDNIRDTREMYSNIDRANQELIDGNPEGAAVAADRSKR
jgi:hypothetical protein